MEQSLKSGLESHNFLTWLVVALIRSLHEKKLLPMDDPVISQLQKSFSKACGIVALCLNFKCYLRHPEEETASPLPCGAFKSPTRRRTSCSWIRSSRQALFSLLCLLRLLALRLVTCPCLSHILRPPRRPPYSSSSAQRGPAKQFSRQSSSQRSFFPFQTVVWQGGRFALPEEVLRNPPQRGGCRK